MSWRKKDENDPITWGDLAVLLERLSSVETEVSWLKSSIQELKDSMKKVEKALDRYKWWILSSILSVWILTVLIRLLLG